MEAPAVGHQSRDRVLRHQHHHELRVHSHGVSCFTIFYLFWRVPMFVSNQILQAQFHQPPLFSQLKFSTLFCFHDNALLRYAWPGILWIPTRELLYDCIYIYIYIYFVTPREISLHSTCNKISQTTIKACEKNYICVKNLCIFENRVEHSIPSPSWRYFIFFLATLQIIDRCN